MALIATKPIWLFASALWAISCTPSPKAHVGSSSNAVASAAVVNTVADVSTEPSGQYLGRKLAEPMSYLGADWLERSDRDATEQPEKALDALDLKAGQTVADVGAGSGYLTVRLAHRVGPTGHVIATDLQPEMLAMIRAKIERLGIANVETVQASESDAKLPAHALDVVLMVDVYHELPEPKATLAQIKVALKPKGILALVEYRGEDPSVPIKEEHKMTLAQIEKELAASAFVVDHVDESLPLQRVVIAKVRAP